ncbi:response regulator transcription factor [Mucilaginibacter gotjawali]|uniref:Phosphate regulon transcriptional regulatory protein PhoB n=2 Tax=Mucilaginibacter gotjawali TaxID=1550579 RepID=A0A120MYG9_9SPHI|nr:response regulator [Mucilaginibacter gotjawali]MBB3056370.1 CheY-like chemotaxis protein [Mucilaginibacter gotjawali]BAU55076.1 Phosphate regulon transcriptional regulatory protein PhoB [Mucilaginibacter gotjawali]
MITILVIEDNDDIRENTCELLELEGYKAITAIDGNSGIIVAKEQLPDIILCDIMMPEANGYEVCTALKDDPLTASIPFIFISASVEKKAIDVGISLGAVEYIQKPFDPQELFDALKRCLNIA